MEAPLDYVDPNVSRELFGWYSPRLGMDMPIVRYGRWGHPLLLLPTAQADFLEYERFWLIKSIEKHILAGRVTVFSIDSINKHAWMNRSLPAPEKVRRQVLYSGYVEEEVVPHIRRVLGNPSARLGIAGASFGAFHAANQFFRRPDQFDTLLAMSGFYDITGYTDGYFTDDVYFNNPLSFIKELSDPRTYDLLHHSQIHIMTGQGDYERPDLSRKLSQLLWDKSIPNNLDLWGYDMKHDWPTWRKMLDFYIDQKLGW